MKLFELRNSGEWLTVNVQINRFEAEYILHHARSSYPEECCGFLLGQDYEVRKILRVIPAQNANQNSRENRYDIDPREFMQADEEAQRLRLELIGFYHSHPDAPARPSSFDREQAWAWYTYLILSVQRGKPGDICVWSMRAGQTTFSCDQLMIVE